MKINEPIMDAIKRAISYYGNVSQLSKAMGIAHSTILFWLSGKTNNISGHIWMSRILPVLSPFMSKEDLREVTGACTMHEPIARYNCFPVDAQRDRTEAKVVPFSALEQFDPFLEPLGDFLKNYSFDTVRFACKTDGDAFAVSVDKDRQGYFPEGTALLIKTAMCPESGDVVVARTAESVLLCRYAKDDENVKLTSLGKDGKKIVWNFKKVHGNAMWIYPVIEAVLNLKNLEAKRVLTPGAEPKKQKRKYVRRKSASK